LLYFDPTGHNVWTSLVDGFVDNWKLGASGFIDNWQTGINELQDSGKGGQLFASYSMGVADTISGQASSTIKVIRNPGQAISDVAKDYVAYGKKDFKNWNPASYLGTKIGEGLVNQAVSSYNLGAEYGAEGVMYALGQSTTIVAETGVLAYGPRAVSSVSNAAKNSISNVINKLPKTVKGSVNIGVPFNSEQSALIQMGKGYDKIGYISMDDANAYVSLAQEVGLGKARIDMGHSIGGPISRNPHLHIGTGSYHIPIK
jgi:hypothetical protein